MAKRIPVRDANGRFINRQSWALAYELAGKKVPSRVGVRNASAPMVYAAIERAAERHVKIRPFTPLPKIAKLRVTPPRGKAKRRVKPKAKRAPEKEVPYPSGTEFELTARYEPTDGRPVLHIKVRVVLTSAMTNIQAKSLAYDAMKTGEVPPGIDVLWLDWARESEGGSYDGTNADALRDLYAPLLASGQVRFAKVAESERDL